MVENEEGKEVYLAFWNFNWGTAQPKDQKLVDHALETYPGLQMLVGVETKVDDFSEMFPSEFKIAQSMSKLSERNIAVVWIKHSLIDLKVRGLKIGTLNRGVKMLPRPLRIFDHKLRTPRGNLRRVRGIYAHRPPRRFKFLDRFFDASVHFRIKCRKWSRDGNWYLIMDFNELGHSVAQKFGGTFYGSGIDGIVCGPNLEVAELVVDSVPKKQGWTDHVGVIGRLRLK